MKQQAMVHMLPTNSPEESLHRIWVNSEGILHFQEADGFPYGTTRGNLKTGYKPQYLYFTTDEEIKAGDWFIANQAPRLCIRVDKNNRTCPYITLQDNEEVGHFCTWRTKVVVTNNPELWEGIWEEKYIGIPPKKSKVRFPNPNMAKISLSFIKEYVEKQGEIEKVWLEYEAFNKHMSQDHGGNIVTCDWKLKLNSDGSVIILPNEEKMINRKQAFELVKDAMFFTSFHPHPLQNTIIEWFDKKYPI